MTGQANGILESLTGRSKDLDRIQYSYDLGNGQFGIDTVIDDKPDMDESQMSLWIPYADGRHRDGVGDLLEVGGINCDRHRANSLILYDHAKTQSLPIAKARDRVTDEYTNVIDPVTKIAKVNAFFYDGKGLANTDRTKEYDHAVFCEQLYDMATQGFVKGGSLGYQVIAARELPPDYEKGTPKGLHLLNVLMLEASLVVLPANADTVRKCLCQDKMCGKPLSPILVKSLTPYASPKKVMLGYENRKGKDIEVPLPEGNLSETNVPPVAWKPGLGATKGASMNGKACSCGSCEKCKSLPEELIDSEEKAFSSISKKFLGKDFPPLALGAYDRLAHQLASEYGGSPAAIVELTKLEAQPKISQHERRVFQKVREVLERTGIKSKSINDSVVQAYNNVARSSAADIDSVVVTLQSMSKEDLRDTLVAMGFRPTTPTKNGLAKQIEDMIRQRRGATLRVSIIDRDPFDGRNRSQSSEKALRDKYSKKGWFGPDPIKSGTYVRDKVTNEIAQVVKPGPMSHEWYIRLPGVRELSIREEISLERLKSLPNSKQKGWDWASWKRAFTDALGMLTDDRTWSEGDVLELYQEGIDPEEAAEQMGKSMRMKSLTPIRKKYRSSKGIVYRMRKSSAGAGMVHIEGKDLEAAQQLAESKGVKFTRVSSLGSLEKVKLMGDDNGIDEVAKQFGRRKSLPRRGKKSQSGPKFKIGDHVYDLSEGRFAEMGIVVSFDGEFYTVAFPGSWDVDYAEDEIEKTKSLPKRGQKSLPYRKKSGLEILGGIIVGYLAYRGVTALAAPVIENIIEYLDNLGYSQEESHQAIQHLQQAGKINVAPDGKVTKKSLPRQRQKAWLYDDNFKVGQQVFSSEDRAYGTVVGNGPKPNTWNVWLDDGQQVTRGIRQLEYKRLSRSRVSTKSMVVAPVVDNGGFAITDATTLRNGWVEKNDVDWAIFPTRLEAEQELQIVQGLVPSVSKSFARFVRLKDIHPDPNVAKIFKKLMYGMLTNQQAIAELVGTGMSQDQAESEIASLDADMRPPTRNKRLEVVKESDGWWLRGYAPLDMYEESEHNRNDEVDLGPFATPEEAGAAGDSYLRGRKNLLRRGKKDLGVGALLLGALTGYGGWTLGSQLGKLAYEWMTQRDEGAEKLEKVRKLRDDEIRRYLQDLERQDLIEVMGDKVRAKSLPRQGQKSALGALAMGLLAGYVGTHIGFDINALISFLVGEGVDEDTAKETIKKAEQSGKIDVTPDGKVQGKSLLRRRVKDLAVAAGPGGIDGTVQTLNSAGITEFLVQGEIVYVPDNPSNRSSLQQMQIPFQAKSLPRQRVKNMNGDIYADETLPEEEEMKDLNGEVQTPEMPYSAQVAQRILADHKTLLKDYDEFNGPQLEHEPTKKLLTKLLEQKAGNLDEWESHVQKHHPDFADSIVGKDLDEDEEEDTQEGLEDVEDDIDEVADDLDADFDSTEEEDTEEKDLPSEGNDATPASSSPEDEPTPEEALEGMSTEQAKSLARRRQKAFRIARQKSLQQRNGRVRRKDFPDEIETTEEQAVIDDPTPIEQDPGMKALASREKAQVAQAAEFADELSQTDNLDQEHRLKAYHQHKTLEELSGDSPLDHDTKSEIGSPEWEAEEGMEPEHKRFRKDFSDDPNGSHPGAMVESSADVPQAMIDAEAVKPPVTKNLHPHRKMCKDASGFFGDIAHTQDFGIPHKEQAKALAKALGDVASSPDEVEMPGEPEMVGNLGEMGQKAFKVGDRVVENSTGGIDQEEGQVIAVDSSGDWYTVKLDDGSESDYKTSELRLKSLRRRVKAGWHKSAEEEEEEVKEKRLRSRRKGYMTYPIGTEVQFWGGAMSGDCEGKVVQYSPTQGYKMEMTDGGVSRWIPEDLISVKSLNRKRLPRRFVRRKSVEEDEKKKKEDEKSLRLKKAFEEQSRTLDEVQKKLALVAAKLN